MASLDPDDYGMRRDGPEPFPWLAVLVFILMIAGVCFVPGSDPKELAAALEAAADRCDPRAVRKNDKGVRFCDHFTDAELKGRW